MTNQLLRWRWPFI